MCHWERMGEECRLTGQQHPVRHHQHPPFQFVYISLELQRLLKISAVGFKMQISLTKKIKCIEIILKFK